MKVTEYVRLPAFNHINFGCGFMKEGNYTYAFGNKMTTRGSDVFVARFPSNTPERDWTFWNGNTWSTNVAEVAAVGHGASSSLNVCKIQNKYVLVTSSLSVRCDMGREIFSATSQSPTGPFSGLKKIFTVDDLVHGHYPFFYLPETHPEFLDQKKELLVTYCINAYEPCLPKSVKGRMNPDFYRPKAMRVPLGLIDPEF